MQASNQLSQNFRIFLQDVESFKKKYSVSQPIQVIAVSKTHSLEKILELHSLGQRDFAENYLNEALSKISALEEINKTNISLLKDLLDINWHFIGHIQSNKAKLVAQNFSWAHSIDSFKLAERLNHYRPAELDPLNILIQVNIQSDPHKYGVCPESVLTLTEELRTLPNIKLRGLMCILREDCTTYDEQYQAFLMLKTILLNLNEHQLALDTLSMGMSHDYEAAIAAGSNMLRIGSAIFGARS